MDPLDGPKFKGKSWDFRGYLAMFITISNAYNAHISYIVYSYYIDTL